MTPDPVRGPVPIDRREAIRRVSAMLGGIALASGTSALVACDDAARSSVRANGVGEFSTADVAFLDEVADTILPETGSPGAKAAKVGAYMAVIVTDCFDQSDRRAFREGMRTLDTACKEQHGTGFMSATSAQRTALLERLDREQYDARTAGGPKHYFGTIKELSLSGYFTSEIGCTQALRYVESPGRYDPCAPNGPDDKIWADHA